MILDVPCCPRSVYTVSINRIIGRWDVLKDGQVGLETMQKKLLKVGGAQLVPLIVTAPPPCVYPEHCHDFISWDGFVGGPATYYITHLHGENEGIIFWLQLLQMLVSVARSN